MRPRECARTLPLCAQRPHYLDRDVRARRRCACTCALASAYGTSYVLSANAPDGLPATFLQVVGSLVRGDTQEEGQLGGSPTQW